MKRNQLWIGLATLTLVFVAGCGGSSYDGGSVNVPPVALINGPYDGEAGQPVLFSSAGSMDVDGNTLSYEWNFGDGGTATTANPSHVYAADGTYTVTLRVYDGQAYSPTVTTSAIITPATAGISGTGFAKGVISGFGSVIIGGTHYNVTGNTSITVDDNPGTENQLEVGDYVEIESTFNDDGQTVTYNADTIIVAESVEGPFDLATSIIDGPDTGVLKVLGQTVRVTPATILDNADFGALGLEELSDGDYLEIHGLARNDGSVDASHVERKPTTGTSLIELTGTISSATPANDTFTINGLTVTYTPGGGGLLDFPAGREPQAGDLVEVKGTAAGLGAGPTLAADTVEYKTPGVLANDDDRGEVEGFIQACSGTPCSSFTVNGIDVQLGSSVTYEPTTLGANDLTDDIKIEAEGSFTGGVLIASKIEFKSDNNSRIEGFVESNSGTALVLMGVSFAYDINTSFEDKTNTGKTIATVAQGDYLEIKGTETPAGGNAVQASEAVLDQAPGDGRMIIRGIADVVSGNSIGVLGVGIDTTGATCKNLDDQVIPCADLLSTLSQGITTIKARGTIYDSGTRTLTASEVELEN